MRRHRLARPDRTGFARGVVADREDEIHHRRVGLREFFPALRTQIIHRVVHVAEYLDGEGVHYPFGLAAGRERFEAAPAIPAQDRLGEDRARGISGAEEQDVKRAIGHWLSPSASVDNKA
jgi:hypothetical protein